MSSLDTSIRFLAWEARALLARLGQLEPLSLRTPAAPAATLAPAAMAAIEAHLIRERRELRVEVLDFLAWLEGADGRNAAPNQRQRRFALLKMRFNAELDSLDIFADVLNQRSEHETGLWLGGLDAAASDGLHRPGVLAAPPPVVTYLDRGHGAAIRRARTRLPGRGTNPVAVIRVPRERMVGSGIGASLLHEVGHQAAAMLDLITSLRGALRHHAARASGHLPAWRLWERWISEIVADLWALGTLGISATTGLIGVVSLPGYFVFRMRLDDPHPFPWLRVMLSCEMGRQLFRDPQWDHLEQLWVGFYPPQSQSHSRRRLLELLLETLPEFVQLLLEHRSTRLHWRSLREALPASARSPTRLRQLFRSCGGDISQLCNISPTLAMATIGQAAADKRLAPTTESRLLRQLLRHWALKRVIAQKTDNAICHCQPPLRPVRTR
ncbi:hypothetical protein [Microbulbifer yueqingensis]|uniref:Uncharacterized protein n=1 Tax=Microbulbifer yueqingensis TaxID=658219 RepID=A0A1G9EIK3_9GAMM|nr:hypothetical protein [Microbulbifer yueqingensis]SDK75918.1 hypothetical protein SAMN05216212_3144 [Microbulbifer yueqingensis]